MASIGMKRFGNWGKVRRLVTGLRSNLQASQDIALKRWGLLAERIAVKHINSQDLGWAPLQPRTITAKVTKGYSENILVQSSTYFSSITSYVKGGTAYAGVKKESSYADGTEVANIAAVHEFGSEARNVPARPLWQPTLKETYSKVRKEKEFNPIHIFSQRIKI